ncbi:MAG TPA: heavy metal-responsive transcriptional regulator [Actinomycetota bacterium]|jgi:DNA-binding transcriptional MerR regulator
MRIGELAQRTGVPTKTIRYYEDIGAMPPASRTSSGYRDFGPDAMSRLQFIRAAQSIGLSLGEIREIVAFRDRGESPCAHVSGLIELHANDLAERIQALEEMRRELIRLAKVARRATSRPGKGAAVCHIIESARPRSA